MYILKTQNKKTLRKISCILFIGKVYDWIIWMFLSFCRLLFVFRFFFPWLCQVVSYLWILLIVLLLVFFFFFLEGGGRNKNYSRDREAVNRKKHIRNTSSTKNDFSYELYSSLGCGKVTVVENAHSSRLSTQAL